MGSDPWISYLTCYGLCREPFFSRAVSLFNSVDDSQKVTICGPHEICMVEGHKRTRRGKLVACWLGFPLQS
jgi:hypothetical protein